LLNADLGAYPALVTARVPSVGREHRLAGAALRRPDHDPPKILSKKVPREVSTL
jgi:hypothetical protein